MGDGSSANKAQKVEEGIKEMKIENTDSEEEVWGTITVGEEEQETASRSDTGSPIKVDVETPTKLHKNRESPLQSPPKMPKDEHEETLGGEITVKMEPGQPPKLQRSSTQKILTRAPTLYDHLPDKTLEATGAFQVITDCTYSNKNLGYTEHAMECDCSEEWGKPCKPPFWAS